MIKFHQLYNLNNKLLCFINNLDIFFNRIHFHLKIIDK